MATLLEQVEVDTEFRPAIAGRNPQVLAARRLWRNRIAMAALLLFLLIVVLCLAAPLYANNVAHVNPFPPNLNGHTVVNGKVVPVMQQGGGTLHLGETPIGRTWDPGHYFLGADSLGRDVAALLREVLSDAELRAALRRSPCSRNGHHAYLGGLLEHTVGVATLCRETAGLELRRVHDLLVAAGPPPDLFLVGLGVLLALVVRAGERPLICLIDDEQWQDQATELTLGFVARRLAADPVASRQFLDTFSRHTPLSEVFTRERSRRWRAAAAYDDGLRRLVPGHRHAVRQPVRRRPRRARLPLHLSGQPAGRPQGGRPAGHARQQGQLPGDDRDQPR